MPSRLFSRLFFWLCWFTTTTSFLAPAPLSAGTGFVYKKHHDLLPSASSPRPTSSRRNMGPQIQMIDSSSSSITISVVSVSNDGTFSLRAALYAPRSKFISREWSVQRSYVFIDEWQQTTNKKFGFILPIFPPNQVTLRNKLALEDYLNQVVRLDRLMDSRELRTLLDIPSDVILENDEPAAYIPEVVFDEYGVPIAGPEKDKSDVTKGAAIGGAVVGFLVGGPFGALIGSAVSQYSTNRDDTAGDIARTIGKGTNAVIKQAKRLDSRYGIVDSTKEAFKKGFQKVKQAVDKLED